MVSVNGQGHLVQHVVPEQSCRFENLDLGQGCIAHHFQIEIW